MRLWWAPPALGALCAGVARETHVAGRSSSPLGPGVSYSPLAHLRYALLLNVLAALVPGLAVKGRVHDPLLNARWWNHEYHSGVLVVSIAALVGTALVYLLIRRKIVRWWAYCFCGAFAGAFPGLFYMIAMPGEDLARVPGFFPLFVSMAIAGFIWGALMGVLIYFAVGRRPQPAGS
jgi:hypothetical protein